MEALRHDKLMDYYGHKSMLILTSPYGYRTPYGKGSSPTRSESCVVNRDVGTKRRQRLIKDYDLAPKRSTLHDVFPVASGGTILYTFIDVCVKISRGC